MSSPTYKENTFDLSTFLGSTQKFLGNKTQLGNKVIKTNSFHLVLKCFRS